AVDYEHPSSSISIAKIAPTGDTITLILAYEPTQRWLLSNTSSLLPMKALIAQAAVRGINLQAFVSKEGGATLQIVLSAQGSMISPETLTPSSTPPSGSLPPPTLSPTLTRVPETYLGDFVATKIDPAIDQAQVISPSASQDFLNRHSWAGLLTLST